MKHTFLLFSLVSCLLGRGAVASNQEVCKAIHSAIQNQAALYLNGLLCWQDSDCTVQSILDECPKPMTKTFYEGYKLYLRTPLSAQLNQELASNHCPTTSLICPPINAVKCVPWDSDGSTHYGACRPAD